MKKISIILSLIFLPVMFAEGKGAPIIPGLKPIEPIVKPFRSVEKPVTVDGRTKVELVDVPGCRSRVCNQHLQNLLEKKEIQILNRHIDRSGQHVEVISEVLEALPAINSKLQNAGLSTAETKETAVSIVAASLEYPKWNDSVAGENLVQYVNNLAADPRAHKDKIREVNENCNLPVSL